MIQITNPDAPTRKFRINWVNKWIDNVHPLSDQDFICFASEDKAMYDATINRGDFELVFLVEDGAIIEMRSLSPCIYTETHKELEGTEDQISKVDQAALDIIAANPEYLKIVKKIAAAIEQTREKRV